MEYLRDSPIVSRHTSLIIDFYKLYDLAHINFLLMGSISYNTYLFLMLF